MTAKKRIRHPTIETWYGVFNHARGPFTGSLFRRKAECEQWIRNEYLVGDDYAKHRDCVQVRQVAVVIPVGLA